ncbi:MAG: hypothetical protein AAGA48_20535 [Myxococcota bacterium]
MGAMGFGVWLLAFPILSWGQSASPPPPSTLSQAPELTRWVTVDRRARTIYKVGIAVGGTGLALDLLGFATNTPGLSVVGGLGELAGAPIMNGAAFRSARALGALGRPPDRNWGYAAWGLFGADVALRVASAAVEQQDPGLATELRLYALLAEIGAYTGAVLQQSDNNGSRKELQLKASSAHVERRRIRSHWAPRVGRSPGLTVVLVWE